MLQSIALLNVDHTCYCNLTNMDTGTNNIKKNVRKSYTIAGSKLGQKKVRSLDNTSANFFRKVAFF